MNKKLTKAMKWTAAAGAFSLAALLTAGLCLGWFPPTMSEALPQDAGGFVASAEEEGTGVSLAMRRLEREEYDDYGVMATAEQAVTVTARVVLADSDTALDYIQGVTWRAEWDGVTKSEAVTDYITMSTTDTTATISCTQAFGTKIRVICTSKFDISKTANLILDYRKRVTGISYRFGTVTGTVTGSSAPVVSATFPAHYDRSTPRITGTNWDAITGFLRFCSQVNLSEGTLDPEGAEPTVSVKPSSALGSKYTSLKGSRYTLASELTSNVTDGASWTTDVLQFYVALTKDHVDSFFSNEVCSALCTALYGTTNQLTVTVKAYGSTFSYTLNIKPATAPSVALSLDQTSYVF